MCKVNDQKRSVLTIEIQELGYELADYTRLSKDMGSSLDTLDCVIKHTKSISEACKGVSAGGSFDHGESATYAKNLDSIKTEIEAQKKANEAAINEIKTEMKNKQKALNSLPENCGTCLECCPPASTDVYGHGTYSGYTGGYWRSR